MACTLFLSDPLNVRAENHCGQGSTSLPYKGLDGQLQMLVEDPIEQRDLFIARWAAFTAYSCN